MIHDHRLPRSINLTEAPRDIATCVWHAGLDPFTQEPVRMARGLSDREAERARVQVFKAENDFEVREGLIPADRGDRIGGRTGEPSRRRPATGPDARHSGEGNDGKR